MGVFLGDLEMLTELLQGITVGISVSYRIFQPQPEPSRAVFQLFQLESWQGWLCTPSQGESCSLQDSCTQQSLGGQKGALGNSVWGNHHPC